MPLAVSFEVFGLSFGQRSGIDPQEKLGGLGGFFFFDVRESTGQDAGQHLGNLPGRRGQDGLVKVVQVKIDKPVLTLIASEVLEVEVATVLSSAERRAMRCCDGGPRRTDGRCRG